MEGDKLGDDLLIGAPAIAAYLNVSRPPRLPLGEAGLYSDVQHRPLGCRSALRA